jgi:hypothetical protein
MPGLVYTQLDSYQAPKIITSTLSEPVPPVASAKIRYSESTILAYISIFETLWTQT